MASRAHSFSSTFNLQIFLAGLKPELERKVRSFNPSMILEEKVLAKQHENKFLLSKHGCAWPHSSPTADKTSMTLDTTESSQLLPQGVKQLTPYEMKRHRELGLRFNCEERYHCNHTYKPPAPLLLLHNAPPSDSSDKRIPPFRLIT